MLFTPEVRYSGVSGGYTISQILSAAFAPLIATALYAANESSVPVVIYLLAVAAISVVSVLVLPGKVGRAEAEGYVAREPRRDAGPAAATTGARTQAGWDGAAAPVRRLPP